MYKPTRKPHSYDVLIGRNVRVRRNLMGMSQEALASAIGCTFQQIQKYEAGKNRIGGSRMVMLAQALNVPVEFLFEGVNPKRLKPAPHDTAMLDFMATPRGGKLIRTIVRIKDTKCLDGLLSMSRIMAGEKEDEVREAA